MIDPINGAKTHLQEADKQLAIEFLALQKSLDLLSTMVLPVQDTQDQIEKLIQGLNKISDPLGRLQDIQNQLTTHLRSALDPLSIATEKVKAALANLTTTVISVDRTGVVDVTADIQKYLDKAGSLYLPAGQYLIDAEVSLQPRSNTDLVLDENAVLSVKPNSNHNYKLIQLHMVENVTITGGKLVGDRDKHTYTTFPDWPNGTPNSRGTHEWGHGIGVYGCQRVTIRAMELYNFTGDGISAGWANVVGEGRIRSTDILIDSVDSHDNRRQGLSITNVNRIKVLNSKFHHIGLVDGTSPRCGIDIEPNNDEIVKDGVVIRPGTEVGTCDNVLIEGCLISDNHSYGLNIFRRVSNITVKNNRLVTNNSCGVVAVDGVNLVFSGNLYDRNGSTGLFIREKVDSFDIAGETFNLNYMRQTPEPRDKPIVESGIVDHTRRDLLVSVEAIPKGKIGINTYN